MTLSEFLTIIAILLAPVVALQVSKLLEHRRAKHYSRLNVFRTLMGTRASPTDLDHISALNAIDVEFYGSDDNSQQVLEAHKIYINHLSSPGTPIEVWNDKRVDLLLDLLAKMASCLGYRFGKTELKTTSYVPSVYGVREDESDLVRRGFLSLLAGKIALPIRVVNAPSDAASQ